MFNDSLATMDRGEYTLIVIWTLYAVSGIFLGLSESFADALGAAGYGGMIG